MRVRQADRHQVQGTLAALSATLAGSWIVLSVAIAALASLAAAGPVSAQQSERSVGVGAGVDTRMAEVAGHALRVQTAGWHHRDAGRPVVVLENGAGAPIEAWQPILETVAGFAPVVAYDRSGIGHSPWDGEPPTPQHVNDRLRALLDQLGAEPPYVLVGFSWGGPLIQHFAAQWPDEVGGLVFIDAPDMRWRMEAELAALAEQGAGAAEREAFYRSMDPMIAGLPPELEIPFDEFAFRHALLRESVARFAASLPAGPHVTLTVAAHARHYIMGDDPDLVIDAIRRVSRAANAARQRRASVIEVAPPVGVAREDRASIVAAVERARPGDTIQFAPGTYLVGALIPVPTPRLTLLGHADGTVLRGCEPAAYDAMDREAVRIFGAPPDPENPRAAWDVVSRCGMMEFTGGHATIRDFTFEYSRLGVLLGCCGAGREFRATDGGYLIEHNTFRNSGNSIRAILSSPVPTVIRNNRFINTFHALSAIGSHLHFVDNHVAVTDPAEVPAGMPGFGISIGSIPPDVSAEPPGGACDGNVIARNHVEGHPNGIFLNAAPASTCTDAEISGNTIIVRRGPYNADWPYAALFPLDNPSDSTIVGVPLTLWGESGDDVVAGRVVNSVVQGNRIIGAEGIGLELRHASHNRIVSNTITGVVRRSPYPGNLDGPPPEWSEAHNGSGIWVSAGSNENEIRGNTFEGISGDAIVLRGDRNVVELRNAGDAVRDLGRGNRASARTPAGLNTPTARASVPAVNAETFGGIRRLELIPEIGEGFHLEFWGGLVDFERGESGEIQTLVYVQVWHR